MSRREDPRRPEIEQAKKTEAELRLAYQTVFRGPYGELVLNDLLAQTGFFAQVGTNDPVALGKFMGMREVGRYVLEKMEAIGARQGRVNFK